MEIDKIRVCITGASQGIGRAIASALAKQGARLALHYNSDNADAIKNYPELGSDNSKISWYQADFKDQPALTEVADRIWKDLGGVDILINNAGISWKKHFLDYTDSDINAFFDVNFKGTYLLTRLTAKKMIEQDIKGSILTVTSVNGIRPAVGLSVYGATKAALEALMKGAAVELAPHGIRLNTIALGAIETAMNKPALQNSENRKLVDSYIPLGRVGQTEEVAELILCLIKADSYMTGATIVFDGGWLTRAGYTDALPYKF